MPSFPKPFKRVLAALPVAALIVVSAGLVVQPSPTQASHLCGNTGSPYGPFDLQTYEDANHRTTYARTMDLAGFNQLLHDRPGFGLPGLEVGGRDAGSGQIWSPYIPPVLLKSIAWIESGWNQAASSVQYGQVGPVLSSHDCGYGIMQVTSGMQNVSGVPNLDQAMIGGHYAFNIARGARILADKWNSAPEFRPIVGDRNPYVLENWYYALWGYNGFAFKNHPLNPSLNPQRPPYRCDGTQPRSDYPYQELVIGCVTNPPLRSGARLWEPQAVQLPNLSDPAFYDRMKVENWNPCSFNLQCAPMDIPAPSPLHTDPTAPPAPREQVIGAPAISVSTGTIAMAALPASESPPATLTIANAGAGVLSWRITSGASWLRVSRLQGVSLGGDLGGTAHNLTLHANSSGLAPGTHDADLVIESLYAGHTPTRVHVVLHVALAHGAIGTADFNGDGKNDILNLCCPHGGIFWLSRGDGTFGFSYFQPSPDYGAQSGAWRTGDFNGDAKTDLIHFCCPNYANVWLSRGDGTFTVRPFAPAADYGMQFGGWYPGDFNGDGRTDLLHHCCPNYTNVWLSQGDGSFAVTPFQPSSDYGIQYGAWHTGEFNGDGRTDLIHLCCPNYANVWLSRGDGTFALSTFQPSSDYGIQFGAWHGGDFNGDGRTDFIHLCCPNYANMWISRGDSTFAVTPFQPSADYGIQYGSWSAGDFNGDHLADIAHICCPNYLNVWTSRGDGTFAVSSRQPSPDYGIQFGSWHPGDYNGDGRTDALHFCCPTYANLWTSMPDSSFAVRPIP